VRENDDGVYVIFHIFQFFFFAHIFPLAFVLHSHCVYKFSGSAFRLITIHLIFIIDKQQQQHNSWPLQKIRCGVCVHRYERGIAVKSGYKITKDFARARTSVMFAAFLFFDVLWTRIFSDNRLILSCVSSTQLVYKFIDMLCMWIFPHDDALRTNSEF
jgi:hypothetical protein